MSKLIMVMSAS